MAHICLLPLQNCYAAIIFWSSKGFWDGKKYKKLCGLKSLQGTILRGSGADSVLGYASIMPFQHNINRIV